MSLGDCSNRGSYGCYAVRVRPWWSLEGGVLGGLIYGEEGSRCWSGKRGNSGIGGGERGEGTRGHSEMMKSHLRISGEMEMEMEMEWC